MEGRFRASKRSLFGFFSVVLVSLLFLLYAGPSRDVDLNPLVPNQEPSIHGNVAGLSRRADADYEAAREKGARLHCLMAMSQEEANRATPADKRPLEASKYLQEDYLENVEGWEVADINEVEPLFKDYLDSAFDGLGIAKELHNEQWKHVKRSWRWEDPYSPWEGEPEAIEPSGAFFHNSFIINAGVIIADANTALKAALQQLHGSLWEYYWDEVPSTRIRQWGDAAWMQWIRACRWVHPAGDPTNVKYIFRAWITNYTTLELVLQAVLDRNQKVGGGTKIGTWRNRITLTVEDNPDEFHAVLGSPNGAGSAFFLVTHKGTLGKKTIDKVDIFVPNVPFTVEGTTADEDTRKAKICLVFHVTDVD